jgi:Flp pilus assembly protein TadG
MLNCRKRNNRKARRGIAATELAMLLVPLTFVLVAVVDFGRLFYSYVTITNCARNGAIYASSSSTAQAQSPYGSVTAAAQADASNLSPLPTVDSPVYSTTYNGTYGSTTPSGDGYVQVTVHWTFNTLVNYPGIPRTMNLSRTVTMRLLPN